MVVDSFLVNDKFVHNISVREHCSVISHKEDFSGGYKQKFTLTRVVNEWLLENMKRSDWNFWEDCAYITFYNEVDAMAFKLRFIE